MNNLIQEIESVNGLVAPAALESGQGVLIGSQFYVAKVKVASGETFTGLKQGQCILPKNNTQAMSQGAILYWDDTAKKVTTTSTANKKIGSCVEDALAADEYVCISLEGVAS